jgi:hypothetical protein
VGGRAGLDAVEKRKISFRCRGKIDNDDDDYDDDGNETDIEVDFKRR